jgi:hypothetical protein
MRSTMRNQVPKTVKNLSREEGFAIPIALGMGLIMILLATTAIVRSQNDGISAINKVAKDQSTSVAELKVAQIQAFLNKYRAAANSTDIDWGTATGSSMPNANASCIAPSTLTSTYGTSAIEAINAMSSTTWTNVDSTDLTKGQFRLVSYSGTTGGLTVEGKTKVGTPAEATSQITVTIPVFSPALEQVPGIWAKTSVTGSPTVKSDVMGPCTGTMDASFPSTGAGSDRVKLRTRMSMPPVPALPTSTSDIKTLTSITNKTLPEAGDSPYNPDGISGNGDDVYQYSVPGISGSFTVTPGKKVSIWVDGNIDLTSKAVVNPCGATGSSTSCNAFDLKVYGRSTSGTMTIDQGSAICDAFFLLPNYAVTVNTGGTTPMNGSTSTAINCGGTTKNTGVYWVNTWNSATGTVLDSNRATWSQSPILPPPRIGPVKH